LTQSVLWVIQVHVLSNTTTNLAIAKRSHSASYNSHSGSIRQ